MSIMKLRATFPLMLLLITASLSCRKNKKETPEQTSSVAITGQDYQTIAIGDQIWTVTNYAGAGGIFYDDAKTKPEYGKYYTFEEAKAIVLPEGWRIPSREDFIKLAESQGVVFNGFEALNPEPLKKLVSKSRWKNISGTNESGFNAYPAGYSLNNSAPQDGDICEFWTTDGTTVSIQEGANSTHRFTFYNDSANPVYKFNLRFVRNR
ncbi:FISUMP domain-containing protein [Arcticibacter tournemirensis]|nr:FISUMP domain-containing protein [Arcticibacter tournemirensis]